MKVTLANRRTAYTRALIWLVDVCGGEASVREVADQIIGSRKGAPNLNMLWRLAAHGWAEIVEDRTLKARSKGSAVMRGRVKVTPAGYLWRDYLRYAPAYEFLNRVEMHARIRALEMAIEPLARVGREYKDADETRRFVLRIGGDALGISPLQLEMAAEVLAKDEGRVIYPWTPKFKKIAT